MSILTKIMATAIVTGVLSYILQHSFLHSMDPLSLRWFAESDKFSEYPILNSLSMILAASIITVVVTAIISIWM